MWFHTQRTPRVNSGGLIHEELNCHMESTSHNFKEAKIANDEALAKAKVSMRISLKACVAKAKGWTLEKANALPIQDTNINKAL